MAKTKIIYHLADIHISCDIERFDEYQKTFEKLYEILENDPEEKMIVICGDLFHEKTGMQSYSLKFCSRFLARLSEYSEIILIDGNHDINMNNKHNEIKKVSTIEGLLELLNKTGSNDKFHYLNENKIVKIKGINYGLTTMFAEEMTKIENREENEIYVGLYHGAIGGSQTDTEYNIRENGKMTVKMMESYDIFLLGDIHKHQFLNKKKTIAYSSSLIQQNYGEKINGHGLIRWDLETKSGTFIEIPNEYCYLQGEMINKNLTINEIVDLSKFKYIRAKIEYTPWKNFNLANVEKSLKKKLNIKELHMYEKIKIIDDELTENANYENRNIINVHEEIIDKKEYSPEDKIELKKIISDIVNEKNLFQDKNLKIIQLKKITFDNLFCYGLNNEINFENLKKINGIIAENGWGKSSIIDILLYSIYQKCGRTKGVKVLNKFKNCGTVNLSFTINDIPYSIVRNIKPRNKNKTDDYREELEFYKNGILMNESYKKDTGKIIEELFGSYDELTDNNILLQNGRNFIDKTDHEKKIIMYKIFGIDAYNEIYEYITNKTVGLQKKINVVSETAMDETTEENYNKKKLELLEKLKSCEEELKIIESKIFEQNYADKKNKELLNNNNIDISTLNLSIENNIAKITKNQTEILNITKSTTFNFDDSDVELDNLLSLINLCQATKDKLLYDLTELKSKIKTVTKIDNEQQLIKKMKTNSAKLNKLINEKNQIILPEDFDIFNIKLKLKELKNIEKEYLSSMKFLEELELENKFLIKHQFNENCSDCMNNKKIHEEINYMEKIQKLKIFLQSNTNTENLIQEYENMLLSNDELNNITKQIEYINNDNNNIAKLLEICKENEKIIANNNTISKEISNLTIEINCIQFEIKKNNADYDKIKKLIQQNNELKNLNEKLFRDKKIYDDNFETIEKNNLILVGKNENLSKQKNIINNIKKIEKEIITISTQLDSNKKTIETIQQIKNERTKYVQLSLIYSEDRLIEKILERVINNIESITNNIMKDITNFTLKFEVNKDGIIINKFYRNEYIDARFLSGYEKFASNVALRIAFGKLNKYVKNDYLIIDEGFSTCDHKNINKIHAIFDVIRKYYNWCIVISHIDQIKNNFDDTYYIRKIDNETYDSNIKI